MPCAALNKEKTNINIPHAASPKPSHSGFLSQEKEKALTEISFHYFTQHPHSSRLCWCLHAVMLQVLALARRDNLCTFFNFPQISQLPRDFHIQDMFMFL